MKPREFPWTAVSLAAVTVVALTMISCTREQRLLGRARGMIDDGDLDGAMVACRRVLDENPQSHEALYVLGSIHYARDAYPEAIEAFDRALEIGGPLPHYLRQRGDSYAHLKQYDNAARDYEEVLKIEPGNAKAHYGLGIVSYNRRNYLEAAHHLERYVKLERDPAARERARKLIEFLNN